MACTHVPIHWVPSWFADHPTLQNAHFAAPFTRQPAPVCGTPCSHVQMFTTKCQGNVGSDALTTVATMLLTQIHWDLVSKLPVKRVADVVDGLRHHRITEIWEDVQIHAVLAWLMEYPWLHDAHLTAPLAGQPAPASGTPLWHVQLFAATTNRI